MKKFVFLFIAAAAAFSQVSAAAGDFLYLTVTRADGHEKSYELRNLKITFSAADMKLSEDGKETTVSLSQLANAKMRFTEMPTAIADAVKSETAVISNGDRLDIKATKSAKLLLYSTDGTIALSKKISAGTTTIDISGLSAGIYVAKIGNKTIKIEKQ